MNETAPSPSGRRFRKLHIAFSAACGILCLLLIVLWVGSGRTLRKLYVRVPSYYLEASTARGRFGFQAIGEHFQSGELATRWDAISGPLDTTYDVFPNIKDSKLGFSLRHDVLRQSPNIKLHYWRFTVPCWFLVVASVALTAFPWIHWPKRFSLSTLLIAMTLVAMLLGAVVWVAT